MEVSDFKDIANSAKLSIFVFSAKWCRTCDDLWDKLIDILSLKKVDCTPYLIDIDEYSNLAEFVGIIGLPSIYIFENGQMKYASLGDSSEKNLKEIIEKYSQTSQEFPVR
jgi:thioredoxin-like negative regulator of GroEL